MQDKDLKNRLKPLDIPAPSEEAQARAKDAAMQAFAAHHEKNAKPSQGFAVSPRPTHGSQWLHDLINGRRSMKNAYVFAGSMAALALVLAVTTIYYPTPVRVSPNAAVMAANPSNYTGNPGIAPPPQAKEFTKLAEMLPAPQNETMEAKPFAKAKQDIRKESAAPLMVQPKEMQESAAPIVAEPKPAEFAQAAGSQDRAAMPAAKPMMAGAMKREAVGNMMVLPASPPVMQESRDQFEAFTPNATKQVAREPVSTFSIDVNTSSYSFVRRLLNGGQLPPANAVRVEEMVNYFSYDYPRPESREVPFKPTVTVVPTPWNPNTKLMQVGIRGYDIDKAEKPRSNLVFLIDVSGSMMPEDRLPLIKKALRMLVDELNPDDTVGIVVYAGNTGTLLEPTPVSNKAAITNALDQLGAGGGTAGAAGIQQAYALARSHYDKNAVNRVILATDGDFNVGVSSTEALQQMVEQQRDSGIYLSVLGVGQGNYNDAMMQRLAQHGNGNAAYIDSLNEAHKVLVQEAGGTLFTIAKDVKIQVEFNPSQISEYRLVGYESRLLNREDFNNDRVDAGDVGAGKQVTAIYEITPTGSHSQSIDALRYQKEAPAPKPEATGSNEYAFVKIRYKLPSEQESKLLTTPVTQAQEVRDINAASDDVRFATAVAAFSQLLKGSAYTGNYDYDKVLSLAESARGKDSFGYRAEFLNLVRLAKSLQKQGQPNPPILLQD